MYYYIVVFIVALLLSALLAPKQQNAVPETPGDVPSISDTQQVPVVFGTVELDQPNVVWYGDLRVTAITSNSGK